MTDMSLMQGLPESVLQLADSADYSSLLTVLEILVLAEKAMNHTDLEYWNIDADLDKHRKTREFDAHVQKMLLFLEKVGSFTVLKKKSSDNGYYYTLLVDDSSGACIRVLHTFAPKAKYMDSYLQMNTDIEHPKFAYIQYETKKEVTDVRMVIPDSNGNTHESYPLFDSFSQLKKQNEHIQRKDITELLKKLKEDNQALQLALKEEDSGTHTGNGEKVVREI